MSTIIRDQFPQLQRQVNGAPLCYLDSGASSLKCMAAIDAVTDIYTNGYSNIHRGIHTIGGEITAKYESARGQVASFLNAASANEIIFTRSGTEAINLVAATWGKQNITEGSVVCISAFEHHANLVPWQQLCTAKNARLIVLPLNAEKTDLDYRLSEQLIAQYSPKLIAISHLSNVLGCLVDIQKIAYMANRVGAKLLVDGCQAIARTPVDVQTIGADFYVFSGHKAYAPSGTGVLWAKAELLAQMPPYQFGGDMIEHVAFDASTFADAPAKFEAGTPNIEGGIALGAALTWLNAENMKQIEMHDRSLRRKAFDAIQSLDGFTVYGPAEGLGAISFTHERAHANDIGMVLDELGVAIRTGHHCAQPLHEEILGINATARASLGVYTNEADIERLIDGLKRVQKMFGKAA